MLSDVDCPQVVFEVGGHEIESTIIKNSKKTPNFDKPLLFLDVVCIFIFKNNKFFISIISIDVTKRRSLCSTNEY
jgi:hypothetical protein